MLHKVKFLIEAFPTFHTFMRLLFLVREVMLGEGELLTKAFPTQGACIGFLPGVDSLVLLEGFFPSKALPAFSAFEGFGSDVGFTVSAKDPLQPEAFVAVGTLIGLLARVDCLMRSKVQILSEFSPTLRAAVVLLLSVNSLVPAE